MVLPVRPAPVDKYMRGANCTDRSANFCHVDRSGDISHCLSVNNKRSSTSLGITKENLCLSKHHRGRLLDWSKVFNNV